VKLAIKAAIKEAGFMKEVLSVKYKELFFKKLKYVKFNKISNS
jgi:hypothetical protein